MKEKRKKVKRGDRGTIRPTPKKVGTQGKKPSDLRGEGFFPPTPGPPGGTGNEEKKNRRKKPDNAGGGKGGEPPSPETGGYLKSLRER